MDNYDKKLRIKEEELRNSAFLDQYLQGKHPIDGESLELPTDSELDRDEALYDALLAEKKPAKRIKLWPYAISVIAVAASIVLAFILWPDKSTKSTVEAPVVAEVVEQTSSEPVELSEPSEISEPVKPQEPVKPYVANKLNRPNKAHRPNRPQAEPAQEETKQEYQSPVSPEPMLSEDLNIHLLAAAQAQDIRSRGERLSQEVALLIEQ